MDKSSMHYTSATKKKCEPTQGTCLTIVEAVVPLQKVSILLCSFSSWSTAAYVFRKDCFHMSKSWRFAFQSWDPKPRASCHLHSKKEGNNSLTRFATTWPQGPWPSNTPQKVMSSWQPNSCQEKHDNLGKVHLHKSSSFAVWCLLASEKSRRWLNDLPPRVWSNPDLYLCVLFWSMQRRVY